MGGPQFTKSKGPWGISSVCFFHFNNTFSFSTMQLSLGETVMFQMFDSLARAGRGYDLTPSLILRHLAIFIGCSRTSLSQRGWRHLQYVYHEAVNTTYHPLLHLTFAACWSRLLQATNPKTLISSSRVEWSMLTY